MTNLQQLKESARKEFRNRFSDYPTSAIWYVPVWDFIDSLITKAYEEGKKEFAKKEIKILEKIKAKDNPRKHEEYCAIKKGYICDCGLAYYYLSINEQIERLKKLII